MLTASPIGPLNSEGAETDRRLSVLFYTRNSDILGSLQTAVARLAPKVRIELHRTLETFSEKLRKLPYNSTVAVIIAADRRDLEDIASLQNLLWGLRTILVLPDGDDATIALGHSLRPRLISRREDNFENVAAVLNKMIEDYNSKPKME
jgi:hypothetical protein